MKRYIIIQNNNKRKIKKIEKHGGGVFITLELSLSVENSNKGREQLKLVIQHSINLTLHYYGIVRISEKLPCSKCCSESVYVRSSNPTNVNFSLHSVMENKVPTMFWDNYIWLFLFFLNLRHLALCLGTVIIVILRKRSHTEADIEPGIALRFVYCCQIV